MIPIDMLDVPDNGDIIDSINDGMDIPEVTDDINSTETETPENPEDDIQENPETKTEQESGAESADVPESEAGQNVHKAEAEDLDLIVNPFSSHRKQWKEEFTRRMRPKVIGSCNICRDDGFSCKGGYKGEHKVGAKCENCGHKYEQHMW